MGRVSLQEHRGRARKMLVVEAKSPNQDALSMHVQPDTKLNAESIAEVLQEALGAEELKQLARQCGFQRRERKITALELLVACISTLGSSEAHWIADIVRTYNKITDKRIKYKPFYNQLAKKEFPEFLLLVLERIVMKFAMRMLDNQLPGKLSLFGDIIIHDGTSFALKDALSNHWPGRFTTVSPSAVELHVTMSVLDDTPIGIMLAPDKDSERLYLPEANELGHRLLLADRGYQGRDYFSELQSAEGYYVIRGTSNIRPTIVKAIGDDGRRLKHLEGKKLKWKILPQETVDLDITWGKGSNKYRGRLVAIYKRGKRNKKTFTYLHTNLSRDNFSVEEVGNLYRLRWQIELLFKEWKSYSNLHRFDTSNQQIAEGLIWASLLAATLKRFLAHSAERVLAVEISTQRVAASARLFFDEVLSTLLHAPSALPGLLSRLFVYFAENTQRAHPQRDRKIGRLSVGLEPIALKN